MQFYKEMRYTFLSVCLFAKFLRMVWLDFYFYEVNIL